jgi:hypothetical protein
VPIDAGDPSKGTVTLRAGFDCGPAMACVVGTRAKKFVLLGEGGGGQGGADPVNTASRTLGMKVHKKHNKWHVIRGLARGPASDTVNTATAVQLLHNCM